MARCETTQAQWRSVMGSVPAGFAGMQRPVENVSWLDVQAFLLKLRQRTRIEGWELRLPTEDEWEYACRADDRDAGFGDAGIWHRGNSGRQTHPVGERQPNAWNLHDMLGNVWEWVDSNVEQEAKGEAAAAVPLRVCRGGSGDDPLASCQPAARHLLPASSASNGVGFRLVASPLMAELPAAGLPVP